MPPKKPVADPTDPPAPSSSDVPLKEKKTDGDGPRKPSHPSTVNMVKEALKALDSRNGVSSQAIQTYIKEKYPSVDVLRLKHWVRKALKKGIETGTLVRPAKSNVTTGAMGKFRLAPQVKEAKPKTENRDPNVQVETKVAKDGAKKPKKAGATKKRGAAKEQAKTQEDSNPPKKSKKEKDATSKAAPAKQPKSKTPENGDDKAVSTSAKPKATKEAKSGAASQSKTAKAGSKAPAPKATGKGGKKTAAKM